VRDSGDDHDARALIDRMHDPIFADTHTVVIATRELARLREMGSSERVSMAERIRSRMEPCKRR
jgi:hypothetical protein